MDVLERFRRLMAAPEPTIALDEAALLIAASARPEVDVDTELAHLDELAAGVGEPSLRRLVGHLFGELGFGGNRAAYYEPDNSFLDQVRRRRTGIPISLSVLTAEVGRRVGVPLVGVGMPGHFLLRRPDAEVFVDPFHEGRICDRAAVARLFEQLHGPGARLAPEHLEPVGAVAIVTRMLGNLRAIYAAAEDRANLTWVLELLTRLPEPAPETWRELGSLEMSQGRLMAAADAYEQAGAAADRRGQDPAGDERAATVLWARLN